MIFTSTKVLLTLQLEYCFTDPQLSEAPPTYSYSQAQWVSVLRPTVAFVPCST